MLLQTDAEFSKASVQLGMAEAFYRFCAENATSLPAASPPIQGREAIRKNLAEDDGAVLRWEPARAEVAASRDLGYTWGTYELRTKGAGDQPRVTRGKYVSVWKKQPGGRWQVIVDIGNQAVPQP